MVIVRSLFLFSAYAVHVCVLFMALRARRAAYEVVAGRVFSASLVLRTRGFKRPARLPCYHQDPRFPILAPPVTVPLQVRRRP